MPIQLPDDSLLAFHPPSAGIPCGTDLHNDKFTSFGFRILSPGTPRFYGGHGSLNHHRNIVAETSHASGLGELQEGHPPLSPTHLPSEASHTISTSHSLTAYPDNPCHSNRAQPDSSGFVMPKKRRSLQAILVPPFFQSAMAAEGVMGPPTPTSSTRSRSHSAAASTSSYVLPPAIPIPPMPETRERSQPLRNSPPSDLLDDDPFANLSPAPAVTLFAEASPSPILASPKLDTAVLATSPLKPFPTPRSPLAGNALESSHGHGVPWPTPPRTPPSTPINGRSAATISRRPRSSGNGQARSAYARPAFRSRPSLPSLNTLAQMHVIAPKVKRGRVGAQLPAEPWESTSSSDTDSYDDHDTDSVADSRRSSGLSTIRDSRLYASEYDEESIVDTLSEDSRIDEDEIVRSTTPRASEVNMMSLGSRPNPLVRAQSDPTPSRSTSSLSFSSDAPDFSDEIASSPETSFPSTPQLPVSIPGHTSSHGHEGYHYISDRFPRQPTHSIYDDLAATLDYDYTQVVSQLHRRPSTLGIGISAVATSTLREEEGDCDFEPGTSARTIRSSAFQSDHQRTPSTQSISLDWTTEMDVNPLSPISTSSFVSSETASSSATSSDYGEEIDFLSFHSDSDEDSDGGSSEYISALGILPEVAARPESPTQPFVRRRTVAGEEVEVEMSDSSGMDITARLGQLEPSETESSLYASAPEEMVDSEGGRRSGYSGSRNVSSEYNRGHATNGYNGSHGGGGGGMDGYGGGAGGGRRGGGGGDDDWNRRPPPRTSVPVRNESDTDEDEESSDDEEDDMKPAPRARPARVPSSPSGTDDDVPLAQTMPTALKAQRTIRKQIRDERDERRRARSLRRPGTSDRSVPVSPLPPLQPLPHDRHVPPPSLPSPKAKAFAVESITAPVRPKPLDLQDPVHQSASAPVGRPRTKTMPSQPSSPFSVGDLTKKLLRVQVNSPASTNLVVPQTPSAVSRRPSQDFPSPMPRSPMLGKDTPFEGTSRSSTNRTSQEASGAQRRLMHMRSFHRPRTTTDEVAPPLPTSISGSGLHRSATSASRKHREVPPPSSMPRPPSREEGRSSLDRARSTRSLSRRPSTDRSARPSNEMARPPLPPLPSGEILPVVTAYQQRIFINTLQKYCQLELSSHSTAHDALELLQNQGYLDGTATGWMIFELCQDFGMERPVRSFETLSSITNSWVTDKTTNVLMAKRTSLAPKLSRAAIPSSSPIYSGSVQWEYKRGKWQKRWLELREHSLWVSKRETGKDQQMLCSLNNFDAYAVTRISKAPKPFVFAVKSTDSLSFFESTTDYVHVFSCEEKDGLKWLESILLARSYVLHQERNILSSTAVTAPAASNGAALSRSGTRKRPAQPLLTLGQSAIADPQAPPPPPAFEPGSLLAKRGV